MISPKGLFQSIGGEETTKVTAALDLEKLDEIVEKWPKLKETSENRKFPSSQTLLEVIQYPPLAAGINTVAFDQLITESTLLKYSPAEFWEFLKKGETKNDSIDDEKYVVFTYLKEKFPRCLDYLLKSSLEDSDDCIFRILGNLILYFGHGAKESTISDLKEFSFGTYARLRTSQTLGELLTSYYYVTMIVKMFPDYAEYVMGQRESPTPSRDFDDLKVGAFDNAQKFQDWKESIPQFENVFLYTVDFACSGTKATIPLDAKIVSRRKGERKERLIEEEIKSMVESKYCGWTPKENSTESLLLFGGTAAGKTTLLQSTIIQVKRAAANLGMIFDVQKN